MANDLQTVSDSIVKQALTAWSDDLAYFIPDRGRLTGFLKSAALCIFESDKLKEALQTTEGKMTMIRALQRGASSGLSLNPQEGKAALVVYKGKVSWVPMKNGLCELALDSGQVDAIEAGTIFANDKFALKKTARGDDYSFEPALSNRGESKAYYAVVVLKSGRSIVAYMDKEQVKEHAKKYSPSFGMANMPWQTSFDAMAEKTVLRKLLGDVHLGKPLADALEADTQAERDVSPPEPAPAKGASAADVIRDITDAKEVEPEGDAPNRDADGNLDIF